MYFCFLYLQKSKESFFFMKPNMFITLFCCALLLISCKNVPVSRDRLAQIIVEMSLVDQMVQDQPMLRFASDTALVYEAIFQKYGYSEKEFQRSLTHHLQKPAKLSKKLTSYRDQMLSKKNALQKVINDAAQDRTVDPVIQRHIDSLMRYWHIDSIIRIDTLIFWRIDSVRTSFFNMTPQL